MAKRSTSGAGRAGGGTRFAAALSSREIPQILSTVLDKIDEDRKQEIRREAKSARVESETLAADLKRLVAKHGEDHPRVRRVQAAQSSAERQAKLAEATVRRIDTFEPPEFGGWTIAGRVWDEKGAPLSGAQVEFETPEGAPPPLGPTTTDDEGEFYATYPAEIVKQLAERNASLFLVIRRGRTVIFRDPDACFPRPNEIRQFRVRVPETTPTGRKG